MKFLAFITCLIAFICGCSQSGQGVLPIMLPYLIWPDSIGQNPAITAHLDRIDGNDLVTIDFVYEFDYYSPGNPDIYHVRVRQVSESDPSHFDYVYGPKRVNSYNEEYCFHPDIVYDARPEPNGTEGHLLVTYECKSSGVEMITFADMPDSNINQPGMWMHWPISDLSKLSIYPRLDVGNVKVINDGYELMLWSVVAVWMEANAGLDIKWSWGFVGGPPTMAFGVIPDLAGYGVNDWCYVPFVDIAPIEYQIWGDDASVNIVYTQDNLDASGHKQADALYYAVGEINLQSGPDEHQYSISTYVALDEGLPQIALDATGSDFNALIIYLRGPENWPIPMSAQQAWTNWEVWEPYQDDGVTGQAQIPGLNLVQPKILMNNTDIHTPSVSLCLNQTYRAVWTDRRFFATNSFDVWTAYFDEN